MLLSSQLITIIVIVGWMGPRMGILRGREKVGICRECKGRICDLGYVSHALWALVCQVLGAAQRPGFYYLYRWLPCLIRLIGTDQGRGGVGLMETFGLYQGGVRSFIQTVRCTELSSRDPLVAVSTGSDHRGSWNC